VLSFLSSSWSWWRRDAQIEAMMACGARPRSSENHYS
jgi:hypothetical protein